MTTFALATSEPYGDIRPLANQRNDYDIDWEAHHTRKFFGVPGSRRPGQGHYGEPATHLRPHAGTSRPRRYGDHPRAQLALQDAAVALRDHLTPPPGVDSASFLIRPVSVILPKEVSWVEGGTGASRGPPAEMSRVTFSSERFIWV